MGGAQPKADPPVRFSSKVVATIHGVSKLDRRALLKRVATLLDRVCDAGADGAETPGAPSIHFLADSSEDARLAAYEDALGRAKARAKSIATLADRKLARVASVREVIAPPEIKDASAASSPSAAAANLVTQMYGIKSDGAPVPPSVFELSADVDLEVTFELQP